MTGLTLEKVLAAKKVLDDAAVPMDGTYYLWKDGWLYQSKPQSPEDERRGKKENS